MMNMPTPYQNHLFSLLDAACRHHAIDLQVWFMGATEPGRYWHVDHGEHAFTSRMFRDLNPLRSRVAWHLNPGMLVALRRERPDWLVVGGGWQFPTAMVLLATPRRWRSRTMFWSTTNVSARHSSRLAATIRRWLLQRVDTLIGPGAEFRDGLLRAWGVSGPDIVVMPNVVDEKVYRDAVTCLRHDRTRLQHTWRIDASSRVMLIPARLIERTKGILHYLDIVESLLRDTTRRTTVLLAGEGIDRPLLEDWVAAHPSCDVRIVGHVSQDRMVELYALADIVCLPSFHEPFGRVVLEALWAGLPVLVSRRCGAAGGVDEGVNGWLFDPADVDGVRSATASALAATRDDLRHMGDAGRVIAQQQFASENVIHQFLGILLGTTS